MMFYLQAPGVVCAAGVGRETLRSALWADTATGVCLDAQTWPGHPLFLGRVLAALPSVAALPLSQRSRNNALLLAALAQIRPEVEGAMQRYGSGRIGVVLGTSTSGIAQSEAALAEHVRTGTLPADFHPGQQELGSPALMLAEYLNLTGPAHVISTACSSGAKALASAARLLHMGVCDAVLCGGVDALSAMTVAGFAALDSVDPERCRPSAVDRCGINIGEGAALFLMGRERAPVALSGWGESSDAHHISAPEPSGRGALAAMRTALERAQLQPAQIDYLNLHGTATVQNDAMEHCAVATLFGAQLPCSSTKSLTGHALGAAGAIEAAIAWLCLHDNPLGRLPVHHLGGKIDPTLAPLNLVVPGQVLGRTPQHVMSNSFAFGGNNASLILSACHD